VLFSPAGVDQDAPVAEESIAPEEYFRSRGFEVRIVERDLHSEHMAAGEPGRASFFAEGRRYFCVDLLRNGQVVAPLYAHGETVEAALTRARERYGSEQG
jgi:hypothetical protein